MKIVSIKYLKSFSILLAATAIFSGCEKLKDFGDTNVNPNGSPEILNNKLLTNAEASIGAIASFDGVNRNYPGLYCQYFSESTYPGNSLYTKPNFNMSGFYSGILMDCQLIINKCTNPATATSNSVTIGGAIENQIGVAKILQAYIYWTVTDRWGNIPYSQALKGVAVLNPKYDSQEDVYKGLISTLASAVTTLDDTKPAVKGDILYSGDNAKWRKLANSLRMLMALRMSKKYPGATEYAATQFRDAFNSAYGYISANADNLVVAYPGGNYRNPWNTAGAADDQSVSKTFTDLLAGLNDTRVNAMASNTNGVPYGLTAAYPTSPAFAHILNPSYREENSPLVVVAASHVWLAVAEAIELGWITGDSKAAYDAGVTASFAQWGITMPANYLTTGPANFNSGAGVASIGGGTVSGSSASTTTKRARIALQQYIAYYPDGLQGWSNWRRSESIAGAANAGVPNLKPTVNALNTSGQIVRRFEYGTNEYSLNNAALLTNIATMPGGKDTQDTRVWWDQ